jgi:hypothetical protein
MTLAQTLQRAFDRLDDFEVVQHGIDSQNLIAAVNLLQESVGITDDERVVIRERLDARSAVPKGAVLMGMILGLMAAQLANDV